MSAVSLVVTFDGGETKTINPNRPLFLLLLEREFGVQSPETNEQLAWLAWTGLGRPGDSLESWLDEVDDIDTVVNKPVSEGGDESGEAVPS